MQQPPKSILAASALLAVGFTSVAQAAPVTWNGSGDGSSYSDANNWDTTTVPAVGDDAFISNSTVNYDVTDSAGTLQADSIDLTNTTFNVSAGVIRLSGATVNVDSTSSLTGNIWDLGNGTINFEGGSSASFGTWESKGTNVFTFDMGATGFNTFNINRFENDGNNTSLTLAEKMALATYEIDMAAFTGGVDVYTIVDFNIDGTRDQWDGSSWGLNGDAMTNTIFQNATLNVINAGSYVANIQWNETEKSIELNVTAIPEPSSFALLSGCLALGAIMLRRRKA